MKATPLRQAGDDKTMKTKRIHGEINQNNKNRKAKQENTVFYSLGLLSMSCNFHLSSKSLIVFFYYHDISENGRGGPVTLGRDNMHICEN